MSDKSLDGVLTKAPNVKNLQKNRLKERLNVPDPKEGFLEFAKRFFYIPTFVPRQVSV